MYVGKMKRLMCTLVRQNFSSDCERALNGQIQLELRACHEYLAMAYHFDRSDVALPGIHRFFKRASDEERNHAERIMEYMNKRGGRIQLESIPAPCSQYSNALEAMHEALKLERSVNESLLAVHALAASENDPNLCDFLETHFLQEQVEAQKQLADYITQLERCEKQLGDYVFDVQLQKADGLHKD